MRKSIALLLCTLSLFAACGGDESIGGQGVLPDEIANVTPSPTPADPKKDQATPPPQQRQVTPPPAATPPPQETTFNLAIDPSKPGGFDPQNFSVYAGTVVVVTNKDPNSTHSWLSNTGAFDSGPIPPGGTFRYRADTPGDYPFKDGEAPYNTGRMVVVAQ